MAPSMSEPQIIMRGRSHGGGSQIIDDFREAYWWLRDHTPEDSRVMAWWDYGECDARTHCIGAPCRPVAPSALLTAETRWSHGGNHHGDLVAMVIW